MASFGKLSEYNANKEDWNSYGGEQLDFFFVANGITDITQKRAILLSSCGTSCYKLFRGLTQPEKPGDKTYTQLVELMKTHRNPKPNPIAERFKFNSRNRLPDESIADYMVELRRLTEHCDYGVTLPAMLRDRLVCGIAHERIQQKLLSEGEGLTLEKAINIALSMESAIAQANEIQGVQQKSSSAEIQNLSTGARPTFNTGVLPLWRKPPTGFVSVQR